MITIDGALLLLQIFFLCSGSSCWSKKSVFHHTPTRCTVFFRSYRSSLLHSINVLPSYFILCARRFPVQLSFRFRSLPSPAFHFQSRFFAIQSLRDPATGRGAITYIPGVARLTFIRIYFQSRNEGELSEEPVVVRPEELPSFPDVFIEPIWSGKLIHEQKGKCMIVKPRFSSIRVSKVMPKLAFQVSRECENWWTQSDCLALLSSKPLPICYSSIDPPTESVCKLGPMHSSNSSASLSFYFISIGARTLDFATLSALLLIARATLLFIELFYTLTIFFRYF